VVRRIKPKNHKTKEPQNHHTMQIFDDLFYFQRIDHLIRTRATGSPDDLAQRIGLSRRHLLRLIGALREQGFPIAFDKCRNTYYYTESVKIRFEVIVGDDELFHIQGGTDNFFEKNLRVPFFGTEAAHICINSSLSDIC